MLDLIEKPVDGWHISDSLHSINRKLKYLGYQILWWQEAPPTHQPNLYS